MSRYYNYFTPFKKPLKEFKKFTPRTVKTKKNKEIAHNNANKLYSKLLSIYCNGYNDFTDEGEERMGKKYVPKNLLIKGQRFIEEKNKSQLENTITEKVKLRKQQKPDDKDLTDTSLLEGDDSDQFINIPDIPPLEGDEEEAKERKGLKIFTSNKLLTRLPILLAQIKAGNNSYKLKNEIRQILYLLYQHNKINKKLIII